MSTKLKVFLSEKKDKKSILRFYREQKYSAAFMGCDKCYIVTNEGNIVASAIVSTISTENKQALLHALVVTKEKQKQGIASNLIEHIAKYHTAVFCFASIKLQDFYMKQNFTQVSINELDKTLEHRYAIYQRNKPDLLIFNLK